MSVDRVVPTVCPEVLLSSPEPVCVEVGESKQPVVDVPLDVGRYSCGEAGQVYNEGSAASTACVVEAAPLVAMAAVPIVARIGLAITLASTRLTQAVLEKANLTEVRTKFLTALKQVTDHIEGGSMTAADRELLIQIVGLQRNLLASLKDLAAKSGEGRAGVLAELEQATTTTLNRLGAPPPTTH